MRRGISASELNEYNFILYVNGIEIISYVIKISPEFKSKYWYKYMILADEQRIKSWRVFIGAH